MLNIQDIGYLLSLFQIFQNSKEFCLVPILNEKKNKKKNNFGPYHICQISCFLFMMHSKNHHDSLDHQQDIPKTSIMHHHILLWFQVFFNVTGLSVKTTHFTTTSDWLLVKFRLVQIFYTVCLKKKKKIHSLTSCTSIYICHFCVQNKRQKGFSM